MSIQGMDVLSTSRQFETISNGAKVSTNAKDGFGPSLAEILPIEMIQAICKHLPQKDIVTFRLMSSVCAAAGMDRLVEKTYVMFTRESFEKLLNISKHPGMSKRVMAIHYDPLRMRAVSEDDYNHLLRDEELQPRSESLTNMARVLEARKKICEEQDLIVKSEFSLSRIEATTTSYIHLEDLLITENSANSESPRIDWDEIIVGLTMPSLNSVDLWSMVGSKSSLTEFLQRHAKTLRCLTLRFCFLKEPVIEWGEVFDEIKSDLTLRRVGLSYLQCLLPKGQNTFDKAVHLEHIYYGNTFHVLLEDRLKRKNLLAKELSLAPSELWANYGRIISST
ncbi:hypothetical protein BPAE_0177g00070 [Botrytis paeoniae]|uniref:F-box domain-containing protein n=1 Tax=Botrytis paeoniae TaxID=278948 RepID=A0A4Z1FHZ0_9HELO|nr:hypothetical protein BPAE_0177g00070 [Botrytis paeoniae]